jgi:hypothetical protein
MRIATPETLSGNLSGPRIRPSAASEQSQAVDRSAAAALPMAEVRCAALIINIGWSGNAIGAAYQLQQKRSFEKRSLRKQAIANPAPPRTQEPQKENSIVSV